MAAEGDGEVARQGELAENELSRQLATLTLARVGPSGSVEAAAAASWWNLLGRLGLSPPLVVVHDLGLLLTRARQGTPRPGPRGPGPLPLLGGHEGRLAAVAGAPAPEWPPAAAPARD